MNYKKAALLILDGWGINHNPAESAIERAETPFFDSLMANHPSSTLITYGEDVGLPEGQMGNSEVGHLNIGAGRVVYQELVRINKAIRERTLHQNAVLLEAMRYARDNRRPLHLLGLVSDGGVHSHISHLKALCDIATQEGLQQVFIHAFTDGRDTDPKSGIEYLSDLQQHLPNTSAKIASVVGRYYAMDRDKRWERIKLAYDLLVHGKGKPFANALDAVRQSYEEGITDEFILPAIMTNEQGQPLATIKAGDVVLCFNFRTDRLRQMTTVLTQTNMQEHDMQVLPLQYCTMTRYDDKFKGVNVLLEKDDVQETLGEVLSKAKRTQVRIAETEKYPHVTFFFSGGRELPFDGEERILVPSPKVATYDLQPEMSAFDITREIMAAVDDRQPDFICLNYANADMVGHTGVFEAAMQAAQSVDKCLSQLVPQLLSYGYAIIIIADHGNSDYMVNPDGSPNTAHSMNPVPCLLVTPDKAIKSIANGRLADVAPTLLALLGIDKPAAMDGKALV